MSHRLKRCSPRWRAATLIEVLAGLAILGSVTVALLLARGNLLAQHAAAQRKLEAVRVADRLLAGWYAQDNAVPIGEAGEVQEQPRWSWRTTLAEGPAPAIDTSLPVSPLRVELFDSTSPAPDVPAVSVYILVPAPSAPGPGPANSPILGQPIGGSSRSALASPVVRAHIGGPF